MALAIKSGNLALTQWVYATMDFSPLAAKKKHLVPWCVPLTPQEAEEQFVGQLLPAAVQSASMDMVEWVLAKFSDRGVDLVATAYDAWKSGSLAMMQWVLDHFQVLTMTQFERESRVRHFRFHGKSCALVMFWLRHGLHVHSSAEDEMEARACLLVAAQADRVDIVQAMFEWEPFLFTTATHALDATTPPPYVDIVMTTAHKFAAVSVLKWLATVFPTAGACAVAHSPYNIELSYLQWRHETLDGGLDKDLLLQCLRGAAWQNNLPIVRWIWGLGVLTREDVVSDGELHVCARYMAVSTLHAMWTLCGDALYAPLFASKRVDFAKQLCALGDGVGLAYTMATLGDVRDAGISKKGCPTDSYGGWPLNDLQHTWCIKWVQAQGGLCPDAPSPHEFRDMLNFFRERVASDDVDADAADADADADADVMDTATKT